MTTEECRKIVEATLLYASRCGDQSVEDLEKWAKEVRERNLTERLCCAICEEMECDGDCPFSGYR